jgi:nucleoside-diphosphate-sugar epimerase
MTNTPITIYGDGSTSRDYTYVDDITEGVISAMNYLSAKQNVYEIINLGNQHPVKLSELISSIEELSGKKLQLQHLPMQAGDVDRTFADIEKAKRLLNYQPKTKLKEGLKKFYDWFQKKNNVVL